MIWVVGIDSGGTRTRAAIASLATGAIVGRGLAGPGNWHSGTAESVAAAINAAAESAFADAGLPVGPVAAVVAGLAGAGTKQARAAARARLTALPWARDAAVEVLSDLELTFFAAFGECAGVLAIGGTGSSCLARNTTGAFRQVGGWGALLDDAGSAYDLGRRALIALIRALDGRGPATALQSRIFAHWNIADADGFLPALRERMENSRIAALAPTVLELAEEGDAVARSVSQEGAAALAEVILTALRWGREGAPAEAPPLPISLHGGLLQTATAYREAICTEVRRTFADASITAFDGDTLATAAKRAALSSSNRS